MRSTLTIANDTDSRLRHFAAQRALSYKEAVNLVLEKGLERLEVAEAEVRYQLETFDAGFLPGVDPVHLNSLVDDLEAGR